MWRSQSDTPAGRERAALDPGVSRLVLASGRHGRNEGGQGMVSRAARLYIGLVVSAAVILVVVFAMRTMIPSHDWIYATPQRPQHLVTLVALQLLFLVCDSGKTPLTSRQTKWSPSSSATLAAVVLLGPVPAALVGATALLSLQRHLRLAERFFNGAMYALAGLAAGGAYALTHGP